MSNDKKEDISNSLQAMFQKIIGTADRTENFKEKEREDNKWMAMLSYIIPPIPFIAERHSAYVKFHSNQGMNLMVWYILIYAFIWIIDTAFPWEFVVSFLSGFATIILVALMAFGIVSTLHNKAKELPIVSKLNLITIISGFFGK